MKRTLILALVCLGASSAFANGFSADRARLQSQAAAQQQQAARAAFQAQQDRGHVNRINELIASRSKSGMRFVEISTTTQPAVIQALRAQGYKVEASVYSSLYNVKW